MKAVEWPTGLVELSAALGVAPQRVYVLASRAPHRYVDIQIPKKRDGFRVISIPIAELKGVQRLVVRRLWPRLPISQIAHGYAQGRSIVTSAKKHLGPTSVLRLDLSDFFPSITDRRVFGYFRKRGASKSVSSILARLCTHRGLLPQGAPTSPGLTNAICYALDEELLRLARSWSLAVTRYSDDIVFSGRQFNWKRFELLAEGVVTRHGFRLNRTKTRYMSPDQSQRVLGLLVDSSRLRMTREMRRTLRAAFHKAGNNFLWGMRQYQQLRGYAEFYKIVYGADAQYRQFRRTLRAIRRVRTHEPPAS